MMLLRYGHGRHRHLRTNSPESFNSPHRNTAPRQTSQWNRLMELCCVEAQICRATHVKQDALTNTQEAKKYVLASCAPRHDAGPCICEYASAKRFSVPQ